MTAFRNPWSSLVLRLRAVPALLLIGCTCGTIERHTATEPSVPERLVHCPNATSTRDIEQFLSKRHAQYQEAIVRAASWLNALEVNPSELRQRGIKGKKKLVELLDGTYRLWQIAEGAERDRLLSRIKQIAAVTYEDSYHDMLVISDTWFKQDATSYLRAALLLERAGLDTTRYRQEIAKAHPRLNAQMKDRGSHQRALFHWYYRQFGLEEPFPLADSLQAGLIARRAEATLLTHMQLYQLTHEIFAPYEYGERLDADPFSEADKRYLYSALELLTMRYIEKRDPDLVAELVSCLRYLRFVDSAVYRHGLQYLLDVQNADGSWGEYERARKRLGDYVRHGYVLHTTVVAIDALTIAFHEPWNRKVTPPCLPGAP